MTLKDTENLLKWIAERLDETLNPEERKTGYCLITFNFGKENQANYISNVERTTAIEAMEETINRLKSQQDFPMTIGGVQ